METTRTTAPKIWRLLLIALPLAALAVGAYMVIAPKRSARKGVVLVDCATQTGTMKNLLGVNNGPFGPAGWNQRSYPHDFTERYRDVSVSFIRVHDLWGAADIDIVFPDFSKDPNDPRNYDFASTDRNITAMLKTGAQVIFRLGYSWSDPPKNEPPRDKEKWAEVCLHIVRHYTDGWADGLEGAIKYWEIWNEPDIQQFWSGTLNEYFDLYNPTARKIKQHDSDLIVGGPALAYDLDFLERFLSKCNSSDTPLDFVSWHVYSHDPYDIYDRAVKVQRLMERYGYSNVSSVLDEWNVGKENSEGYEKFRDPVGAAFTACGLIYLQNSTVDIACFYRGDSWTWGGLFTEDGAPGKAFHVFKAFRQLLHTPTMVSCKVDPVKHGFTAVAGTSKDKRTVTIIVSNYKDEVNEYELSISNLPWGTSSFTYEALSIDSRRNLDSIKRGRGSGGALQLSISIEPYAVHIVKLAAEG